MLSSLFANIIYPLLASVLVVLIRFEKTKPIPEQISDAGVDFCVLAMGATAGVLGNPKLGESWGADAVLRVGLALGLVSAIMAAIAMRVIPSMGFDTTKQAKINFGLGVFALALVSLVNVVAEW